MGNSMRKIINLICVVLGIISMVVGIIGIVLPILPTTPFFHLSAFLFAKGSEKFHKWFINTGLYKKYIVAAVHNKEMTLKQKIKMLSVLGIIFIAGFIFSPVWYAKALIACIAIGHLYYFGFKVKTLKVQED